MTIKEISRRLPDTRKIEVRNNLEIHIKAKCVVTAEGHIYIDIDYNNIENEGEEIPTHYFEVIPIEDVDW